MVTQEQQEQVRKNVMWVLETSLNEIKLYIETINDEAFKNQVFNKIDIFNPLTYRSAIELLYTFRAVGFKFSNKNFNDLREGYIYDLIDLKVINEKDMDDEVMRLIVLDNIKR